MRCLLPFAIAATLTGCNALSGRCLYELRNANAEGSVSISGTDSAFALVTVSEQRDYQPDKNLSWQVRGPLLKGHVTAITLRDQSGTVKYNFDIDAGGSSQLSGGFVRQSEGADINGFFDMLSSGQAKVIIDRDNGTPVTIPLQRITRDDWNRPFCS